MKYIVLGIVSLFSVSAFSSSVDETVAQIEMEENAKCIRTGLSRFSFCTGQSPYNSCSYKMKFKCISNSGDFDLKLKVKKTYNTRERMWDVKVKKVTFKR